MAGVCSAPCGFGCHCREFFRLSAGGKWGHCLPRYSMLRVCSLPHRSGCTGSLGTCSRHRPPVAGSDMSTFHHCVSGNGMTGVLLPCSHREGEALQEMEIPAMERVAFVVR